MHSVDLFSVTCTTCQARLRVRSESVIGQIINCPKCESMVQIVPPPDWAPATQAADAPSASTASAGTLPKAAPAANSSSAAPASAAADAAADAAVHGSPTPEQAAPVPTAPPAQPASPAGGESQPAELAAAAGLPVPPPTPEDLTRIAWTSPAEQAARRLILWGALGGTSVLLVAVLGAYFITRAGNPPPVTTAVVEQNQAAEAKNNQAEKAENAAANPQPEAAEPASQKPQETPESPAVAQEAEKKAAGRVAEEAPAFEEADALPHEAALAADDEPPMAVPPVVDQGSVEAEALATEPLDDANTPADETLFPAFAAPLEGVDPSIALSNRANELPGGIPGAEADTPASEETIADEGPIETVVVRRIPTDEQATPVDLEARLADRLQTVELRAVPLIDWIRFFSDWTTLPISLDVAALESAGIDLRMPISVRQQNAAAAEVLTGALASVKLTYRAERGQIVVTTGIPTREVLLRVDDLVTSDPLGGELLRGDLSETQQFARLVQSLVAPGSWKAHGGQGTLRIRPGELHVTQSPGVLYEVVIFCEKLRVARGLSPRSRLNPQRFAFAPRVEQGAGLLARPVTFTFHEPSHLQQVTRFLEEQTGATLLIDWQSLASEQFTPATQITCAIEARPLGEALTAVLAPLHLGWRVVDEETLEIFSQQDTARKAECEFYSLRSLLDAGMTPEAILAALRRGTPERAWVEGGGVGSLRYDPQSRHLIVLQTSHMQAEVSKTLGSLDQKLAADR